MVMARKSMGDYMVEKGYLNSTQLEEARKSQQNTRGDLAKILVNSGIDAKFVYEAKAQELGLPFVDLSVYKPDPSALNVIPAHIAKRHSVVPVKKDGNMLYVAMSDPNNITAQDDLRLVSRCTIRGVMAVPAHIEDALSRLYADSTVEALPAMAGAAKGGMNPLRPGGGGMSQDVDDDAKSAMSMAMAQYAAKNETQIKKDDEDAEGVSGADEAPIVRLATTIIQQAIKDGASDIHIEPDKRGMRVRYRIDGVLHETMQMPKYIQMPLTARYKIMSEMNIAERRIPQDGRIAVRYKDKDYDLRVSCLPNLFGEKIEIGRAHV